MSHVVCTRHALWRGVIAGVSLGIVMVSLLAPSAAAAQPAEDLMTTLAASPDLSRFTQLLQTSGVADTLRQPGPYTVWAPVNSAFEKLPSGALASLTTDPARLREVLTYHVGLQPVTAAQIVQVPTVRTLEGESIQVRAVGGSVKLNDATVTRPDVRASNGIIHVVDGLLLPPSRALPAALPNQGQADARSPVALLVLVGLLLLSSGVVLRARRGRGV
jgi:uncharacterized surface protein with fasciclin (FAS1) repeats